MQADKKEGDNKVIKPVELNIKTYVVDLLEETIQQIKDGEIDPKMCFIVVAEDYGKNDMRWRIK